MLFSLFQIAGLRDSQSKRKGCPRVPCEKMVVLRFFRMGKSAEALVFADLVEAAVAARQELMGIGLVAHIEDEFIARRIENPMEGDRQFHHAEIGGEMPSIDREDLDDPASDLICKQIELSPRKIL